MTGPVDDDPSERHLAEVLRLLMPETAHQIKRWQAQAVRLSEAAQMLQVIARKQRDRIKELEGDNDRLRARLAACDLGFGLFGEMPQ